MADNRNRLDDLIIKGIDKVETKVDNLGSKVDSINNSLVKHMSADDIIQKNIDSQLQKINSILEINTESLQEHMRRTAQNETMIQSLSVLHESNDNRLNKLEEPSKVFKVVKRWFIGIGAIAGAVAGILKFLKVY